MRSPAISLEQLASLPAVVTGRDPDRWREIREEHPDEPPVFPDLPLTGI